MGALDVVGPQSEVQAFKDLVVTGETLQHSSYTLPRELDLCIEESDDAGDGHVVSTTCTLVSANPCMDRIAVGCRANGKANVVIREFLVAGDSE